MIWRFFGLKEAPFSITPDPDYLYLGQKHRHALNEMLMGVEETIGFVVITGEVGTGKTTLCRFLMRELEKSYQIAYLNQPVLSGEELLKTFLDGIKGRYLKKDTTKDLLDKIRKKLEKHHDARKPCLLVIDEAQLLDVGTLEMIRLLTNFETDKTKLLQVLLVGQPELNCLLERHDVRQVAQRITAHLNLSALTQAEVGRYIEHRLATAGASAAVFTMGAKKEIFKATGGLPRLINTLAERSMHVAYRRRAGHIDTKMIREAVKEWSWAKRETQKTNHLPKWLAAVSLLLLGAWFYLEPIYQKPDIELAQLPKVMQKVQIESLPFHLAEKIRAFSFSGLVYSDDKSIRQVVSGKRTFRIGDNLKEGIILEDIEPDAVLIKTGHYLVRIPIS